MNRLESSEPNNHLCDSNPDNSRSISEEHYWEFFQSTPLPIIMATFDGTLLFASRSFWEILNKTELVAKPLQNLFDLFSFETIYVKEKFYALLNRQRTAKNFPLLFGLEEDSRIKCLGDLSFQYDRSQDQTAIVLVLYPSQLEASLIQQIPEIGKVQTHCITQYLTDELARLIKLINSQRNIDASALVMPPSNQQRKKIDQEQCYFLRRLQAVMQLVNPVFPSRENSGTPVSLQNVNHGLQNLLSQQFNSNKRKIKVPQINLSSTRDFHRSISIYEKYIIEMFTVLLLSLTKQALADELSTNDNTIEIFIAPQEYSKGLNISCDFPKSLTVVERDFAELYLTEITQIYQAQYKIQHQLNTCSFEVIL
jgi:hypothetical protein